MVMLATFALLLLGLVMVYSTSSVELASAGGTPWSSFVSQAVFAVVGIVAALVLWRLPYSLWMGRAVWVIWGIGIVLLVATWLFGDDAGMGAQRWLYIGSFSTQPSEFVKIALLMVFVRILADARDGIVEARASLVRFFLMVVIPLAFLYKTQSDLGTTLVVAVGLFAVAWLGGISGKILGVVAGIGVAFVLYAIFGTGYRSDRMVFLNPWDDGEGGYGSGFNLIRSLYAIAEGGLFGVGLGGSHEKYDYLFASDNDFIFAVICEELGMVGALVVIALYLVILYAGLRIASETADEVGALLAGGCTIMLVAQAFINIGSTIGVLPTTGKPLPFISSGGTSLVASFLVVGLILSVSNVPAESAVYERRRADLRIVRATGFEDGSDARGSSSRRAQGRSGTGGARETRAARASSSRGERTSRASRAERTREPSQGSQGERTSRFGMRDVGSRSTREVRESRSSRTSGSGRVRESSRERSSRAGRTSRSARTRGVESGTGRRGSSQSLRR